MAKTQVRISAVSAGLIAEVQKAYKSKFNLELSLPTATDVAISHGYYKAAIKLNCEDHMPSLKLRKKK